MGKLPFLANTNSIGDLSVYHGIAGMLSSVGKFGGTLAHVDIAGSTDTPDFEVQSGGHRVQLTTEFSAYVDAIRGDTFLKHVMRILGGRTLSRMAASRNPRVGKARRR
jgi:hypothetical protein